jgi:hypothetical protein
MDKSELEELLNDCPTLYHMAEHGSWPSIRDLGLLSTTALLDLYEVKGQQRSRIENERRSTRVPLTHPKLPQVFIRDQIPMDDRGLLRCLPADLTPGDWYRLLNRKVFFWLTKDRLLRLLNAGAYKADAHDVLEIDSRALVSAHKKEIWFSPMNSGCTKPMPHPRDRSTFLKIDDYPYSAWRKKRKAGERVVELAVEYSVPNVKAFVTRVSEMKGGKILRTIYKP